MSAALEQLKGIIGIGWPGLAESILNRHAHELAEKIRADELCTKPQHKEYFANLIDPEVPSNG